MIGYIVRWLIRHDLVFVVAGPPGPKGPSGDRGAQGRMGKDGPVTAQFIPTCCVHCVAPIPLAPNTPFIDVWDIANSEVRVNTRASDVFKPPQSTLDTLSDDNMFWLGWSTQMSDIVDDKP